MRTRTKARQRAVEALFEAEQRGADVAEIFQRSPEVNEYAVELATTAQQHLSRIDEILATYSQDWPSERMPAVDRAILRTAIAEMLYSSHVDTAVVIAEAVDLATRLSTDESGKFINGILGKIAQVRNSLQANDL